MRKPLIIVASVIVALLASAAAFVLFFDANKFREPVRAQLERRLGRRVQVSQLGLKLVPLSIRLDDVKIGEAPGFESGKPFASAKQMYVRVGIAALLNKQIDVESLHIVQPTIELIRNANGEWNVATIGASSGSGGKTALDIGNLRIEDGRVAITDLQHGRPRAVYDHIDVALRDFKPGHKFDLTAQVHLPAKGSELIKTHVTGATPQPGQSLLASDLDGGLSMEAASVAALQAFMGSSRSESATAILNGEAQFKARNSVLEGKGGFDISEPRLKEPARLAFDFRNENNPGVLTISNAILRLGTLTADANATIHTQSTPATLTGGVRMNQANLLEAFRLASAFGVANGISGTGILSLSATGSGPVNALAYNVTGALVQANLSLDTLRKPVEIQTASLKMSNDQAEVDNLSATVGSSHIQGSLTVRGFAHPNVHFNADIDRLDTAELQQLIVPSPAKKGGGPGLKDWTGGGTVVAGTLTYDKIALTNVHATCKLENGTIVLDPLNADLFGGAAAGRIAIDTRQAQTSFDVRAKLQKVDSNALLSRVSAVRLLSGPLSGDLDLHVRPQPGQDLARALNGNVNFLLTGGRLTGVHLLNEMITVARFAGYQPGSEKFTNIAKLSGSLHIENGVANTDDLQMQFDGGSMAAAGSIGLADQQLRMRVTTVLDKKVSALAGPNQVAGIMTAALSNAKGEMVIPAIVSGTFERPRFEPDAPRIARMKLEGLLPTRDNPNGAASTVQGIFGALTRGKATSARPSQEPKNGILDLIDSVRKQAVKK